MRNAAGPDVAVHVSDEEERLAESDGRKVRGHDETIIQSTQYQQCVESLRNQLFSWASQSYSASRVGDLAGDTWSSFRRVVDEALVKLDMGDHLTAIETGLTSSNSQDWRLAMYGVRDVIRDLGNQLWLVADETYPYLDNDNGKPIRVTELEYVNRLWAYLHQKGVTGRTGKYLRAELRRIHALDDFANKAHKGVTQDELRLAVIGIYTVLGELVTRTDLQPVTEVVAPDKEADDA
jgi:hypothetical protein